MDLVLVLQGEFGFGPGPSKGKILVPYAQFSTKVVTKMEKDDLYMCLRFICEVIFLVLRIGALTPSYFDFATLDSSFLL